MLSLKSIGIMQVTWHTAFNCHDEIGIYFIMVSGMILKTV